jgi:hypothetical protein
MTSQEDIFKFKYLKYKQKYLDLKKKIGGGNTYNSPQDMDRIRQYEMKKAEKKRKEAAEEQKKIEIKAKAEPLIKQINELHTNTINVQCGLIGCRTINSNIKNIEELIKQIRVFSNEIADSVITKLNESTDKKKKCNCISLF